MDIAKLDKPKIKDLVSLLLTFDQEKQIRIEDADTNWEIHIIRFLEREEKIFMYGTYSEMND